MAAHGFANAVTARVYRWIVDNGLVHTRLLARIGGRDAARDREEVGRDLREAAASGERWLHDALEGEALAEVNVAQLVEGLRDRERGAP
jgi:hypothetical protein